MNTSPDHLNDPYPIDSQPDAAIKVSDYVIDFLSQKGIDKVFGYIGGNNAHIFDSVDKHPKVEIVTARHEQGAGFAAEGYARATGKTGVATGTSGPGGTNMITPIASCYLDSVPSMFIVGDINSHERDPSIGVRQIGFQDIDVASVVAPITKHSVFIHDVKDLRYELEKAYFLSQDGRKGPVLICIPVNIQYKLDFNPAAQRSFYEELADAGVSTTPVASDEDVRKAADLINQAKRPMILIGGGVKLSNAETELHTLLKNSSMPVVYSLMGKDVVPASYPHNMSFIGRYGNRYGNLAIANSDLILALGTRIDTLQTGRNAKSFAREAKVIQVDIDEHELGLRIPVHLPILSDVREFLKKLNSQPINLRIDSWLKKIGGFKQKYPSELTLDREEKPGNRVISLISKYSRENDIFCVDVGEHQMLAAQSLEIKRGQKALFAGGLAAMGFALPAAIGATLGTGNRSIVIIGDGGLQINIQELEVLQKANLPVKIFVLNNSSLFMVTTMQDAFLEGYHVGTEIGYSAPDFKKVGEAYGITSYQVSATSDIESIIKTSLENDNCVIVDVQIEGRTMLVQPTLDYDRPFEDMYPHLSREVLREHMDIKMVDD